MKGKYSRSFLRFACVMDCAIGAFTNAGCPGYGQAAAGSLPGMSGVFRLNYQPCLQSGDDYLAEI